MGATPIAGTPNAHQRPPKDSAITGAFPSFLFVFAYLPPNKQQIAFYRKRLESAPLAIFVDVSDQFMLRGAFGFLFCRGAAGLSGNRARHAGTREHFEL